MTIYDQYLNPTEEDSETDDDDEPVVGDDEIKVGDVDPDLDIDVPTNEDGWIELWGFELWFVCLVFFILPCIAIGAIICFCRGMCRAFCCACCGCNKAKQEGTADNKIVVHVPRKERHGHSLNSI